MATKTAALDAYATAVKNIDRMETSLRHARQLRADSIRALRNEDRPWAEIEELTGLTRQRLNQLIRQFPAA